MAATEQPYEFLLYKESKPIDTGARQPATQSKLLQFLFNNLRLGQWAPCRACLPLLFDENAEILREVLYHLIIDPSATRW